jgi:hypothetical protein
MPNRRQTDATVTPVARFCGRSNAWCAAAQPLFFELRHVHPRPLTGQLGVGAFQGQINVGVGQGAFQSTYPLLQTLQLVNLLRLFHSDDLSAGAIAVFLHPLLHRVTAQDAILAPDVLKGQILRFQFPHQGHLERFAIPNPMVLS